MRIIYVVELVVAGVFLETKNSEEGNNRCCEQESFCIKVGHFVCE